MAIGDEAGVNKKMIEKATTAAASGKHTFSSVFWNWGLAEGRVGQQPSNVSFLVSWKHFLARRGKNNPPVVFFVGITNEMGEKRGKELLVLFF